MLTKVRQTGCLILALVTLVWLFISASISANISASVETGELELRVTDHQAGIEDFRTLQVTLESIAIHPKGSSRREGWIDLTSEYSSIDIVPLKNGVYVSAATFQVPAGPYDAVKVRFREVEGELNNNEPPNMAADDTTVATSIDVSLSASAVITIDLYVESLTDHEPNKYVVKVKEIRNE